MSRINRLQKILQDELSPSTLEITDESHLHAGHHTNPGGSETHLKITILSEKFSGLSLIARHRMVNDIIKDDLNSGLHAIKLTTKTKSEVG